MYNVEKFIESCLNSIFAQTFHDFEVIVIDDCSTDRSFEIVQKIFGDESRLKLFRNIQNLGEGATRNLGLTIARGKYVYFMDSDDALTSNSIETLVDAMEKSQAEIVYMNSRLNPEDPDFVVPGVIKIKKIPISNPKPRLVSENLFERLNVECFNGQISATPWIKIQRRDFLFEHKIIFPHTTRSSDLLFMFAEFCFAKKIQVIDFGGYIYRPVPTSVMKSSAEKQLRNAVLSLPIAVEYVEKIFESSNLIQSLSRAQKDFLQTRNIYLYYTTFIMKAYRAGMTSEKIFEILSELVYKSEMFSPNLMRAMIIGIARNMIQYSR